MHSTLIFMLWQAMSLVILCSKLPILSETYLTWNVFMTWFSQCSLLYSSFIEPRNWGYRTTSFVCDTHLHQSMFDLGWGILTWTKFWWGGRSILISRGHWMNGWGTSEADTWHNIANIRTSNICDSSGTIMIPCSFFHFLFSISWTYLNTSRPWRQIMMINLYPEVLGSEH
jgi:hypothetical protein